MKAEHLGHRVCAAGNLLETHLLAPQPGSVSQATQYWAAPGVGAGLTRMAFLAVQLRRRALPDCIRELRAKARSH